MAVKVQELTVRYYTGLAKYEKPINNDVHAGDKFLETDTGNEHTYTGGFWALTHESNKAVLTALAGLQATLDETLEHLRTNL